jgi:hypothetical protein
MLLRTLTLMLFLSAMPLYAGIGETCAQCAARYGNPERDGMKESGLLYFRKDGICTIAHFYKGKCDVLSIFSEKNDMGVPVDLPSERIQSELKKEGGSSDWIAAKRYSINGAWCTPDKESFAIYDTMRHKLVIMTHDAYVREKRALKEVHATQSVQ